MNLLQVMSVDVGTEWFKVAVVSVSVRHLVVPDWYKLVLILTWILDKYLHGINNLFNNWS